MINYHKVRAHSIAVWRSLRHCHLLHIGEKVRHNGEIYITVNGNTIDNKGRCIWDLVQPGKPETYKAVRRDHFRRIITPRTLIRNALQTYRFFSGYWIDIWIRESKEKRTCAARVTVDPFSELPDRIKKSTDNRDI